MKDIITKILWKIQILTTTKVFELFLWIVISGEIATLISNYLTNQHLTTIYYNIFLYIFVYYSCYKMILE